MNIVSSVTHRGSVKSGLFRKKCRDIMLSAIAIIFTLAPLFSFGIWIKNSYFSDYRETTALAQLDRPGTAPALFNEPLVSVTFDDGWESVYSGAAPILEEYNVRTTQYILSGQFDRLNYLSEEQVLSLQEAGHDIQSHTISHADLKTLDNPTLKKELSESKEVISKLTRTQVTDFASPLNSYDQRTIAEIEQHYRSHRNTEVNLNSLEDEDYNLPQSFNRFQIKAFSVDNSTTDDDIKHFLAEAKKRNAWAVLVYHEVEEKSSSRYAVTPSNFRSQMKAVRDSNLKIATMDEILDYYEASQFSVKQQ